MSHSIFINERGKRKDDELFTEIISNQILITAIVGWFAAQIIKIIVDIFRYRKLDWRLLLRQAVCRARTVL